MTKHLAEIATQVTEGAHAVLVCDGAGWHQTSERLIVPSNITLLRLPPYAPELNPVENVWEYLRGNQLSSIHPAGAACAERRGWTGGQRFWSAMSSLRLSMPRMVKPSVARSSVS